MYAIRVRTGEPWVDVVVSEQVAPEEALRAISHAYALAEASQLTRALCDFTALTRPVAPSMVVLGAAFAARFAAEQRVAVLCAPAHLSFCRRLARLSGFGENFGLFTREADARNWLEANATAAYVPETTRRHLEASTGTREAGEAARLRAAS